MSAIKNYNLEVLVIPHTNLNFIDEIIEKYREGKNAAFTSGDTHLTYDAKDDENIEVAQYTWTFDMECDKARELEKDLQAEPTVYRFLLIDKL